MAGEHSGGASDPFGSFFADFWKRMGGAGVGPGSVQGDAFEQGRKAFFAAWSQYLEEYMRSEAFLSAMKQSMDGALAWQQMMNEQFRKGLGAAQMPTREDADHVVVLVRGMEERLLERLDELSRRIEKLEKNG